MTDILWIIAGYIAGSCPTGYLLAKFLKHTDLRQYGSGNIGATNAGRLLGKKYAVFIALFDMLKGGIVVFIASRFVQSSWIIALTGAFAVLGHNYPVWLGFKGGKGVATTFGVIFFYAFPTPLPALSGGAAWYIIMKTTKYVSVASIAGLFFAALMTFVCRMPLPYFGTSLALAVLSAYRHKANIQRLASGTENKVD